VFCGVRQEGSVNGVGVALKEFLLRPTEVVVQERVFVVQGGVGNGAGVGADAKGNA